MSLRLAADRLHKYREAAQAPPGSPIGAVPLVRPFLASDYVALHEQILQASGIRLVDNPRQTGEAYFAGGPAFTATTCWPGPQILGSAGLVIQWPGRACAWAVLASALRQNPRLALWFTLRLKGTLRTLMAEHGLHRVEADVWATNGTGIRWLRAIGFERSPEAHMELYGPHGEAAFRFVLLNRSPHSIPLHPTGGA